MKKLISSILIFLSGFLTIPLFEIIPVAGGGEAMIVVFTVPFMILLALVLSIVYYVRHGKVDNPKMFTVMVSLMVMLNLILYPYG